MNDIAISFIVSHWRFIVAATGDKHSLQRHSTRTITWRNSRERERLVWLSLQLSRRRRRGGDWGRLMTITVLIVDCQSVIISFRTVDVMTRQQLLQLHNHVLLAPANGAPMSQLILERFPPYWDNYNVVLVPSYSRSTACHSTLEIVFDSVFLYY